MFLTKNRLKKIKRVDDDDMLNYLKYSHLEPIKEDIIFKDDKATQYPDIRNNFTQTKPIQTNDKETDTYDDLNKMDRNASYILKGFDKSFKNDKQTQVNSYLLREYEPKNTSSKDDDDGAVNRNIKRGFRLAEFALEASLSTALTTAQIAQSLWNATSPPEYDINNLQDEEEVEEEVEAPTNSVDVPHIARDRSRSRDSSDLGNRLLQRGASRSRSITPSSTPASSAKTTPRKK